MDLDATGASVTHLRCGYFFTNRLTDPTALEEGVLRVTWPVDLPLAWVDPRDVGDVAAARLIATDWSSRHVHAVHGPEDLPFAQAAAIVAEATGRPLRAEQIPDDAMRDGLRAAGLGEAMIDGHPGNVDRPALRLHPGTGPHPVDHDADDAWGLGVPACAGMAAA